MIAPHFINSYPDLYTSSGNTFLSYTTGTNKTLLIKNLLQFIYTVHSKNLLLGTCENFCIDSLIVDSNTLKVSLSNNSNIYLTKHLSEITRVGYFNSFYQHDSETTPPECFFNHTYNGFYSDMWIIGCIIYYLLLNHSVYFDMDIEDRLLLSLKERSLDDNFQLLLFIKQKVSLFETDGILKLIKDFYKTNNNYSTSEKLFYINILNDIFKATPSERLLSHELLNKYFDCGLSNTINECEKKLILQKEKDLNESVTKLFDKYNSNTDILDLNYLIDYHINEFRYLESDIKNILQFNLKYIVTYFIVSLTGNNTSIDSFILDDNHLFMFKLVLIIKTVIISTLVNYGLLDCCKDIDSFIKPYLFFTSRFNENNIKNDDLFSLSNKLNRLFMCILNY